MIGVGIMTNFNPSVTRKFTRRIPGNLVPVIKQQGRLRLPHTLAGHQKPLVAPAFYVGWQEGPSPTEGFSLYTLIEAIPGHAQWSTVSGKTLEDAGFVLPSRETGREHTRSQHNDINRSTRTAA